MLCSTGDMKQVTKGMKESSRLPAGAISLIKQGMHVTDGEQHISCSKDPQPRDDVTLPEDDKWF